MALEKVLQRYRCARLSNIISNSETIYQKYENNTQFSWIIYFLLSHFRGFNRLERLQLNSFKLTQTHTFWLFIGCPTSAFEMKLSRKHYDVDEFNINWKLKVLNLGTWGFYTQILQMLNEQILFQNEICSPEFYRKKCIFRGWECQRKTFRAHWGEFFAQNGNKALEFTCCIV